MLNDIKFGIRILIKNPGFTIIAVLSLALGIGANTVVFTWIQNLLMHPLPGVFRSDQLVVVVPTYLSGQGAGTSHPDLQDLGAQNQTFSGVLASQNVVVTVGYGNATHWAFTQMVTANFFDVLGVKAMMGRTFLPSEGMTPGAHPVVVISHGLWERQFGRDPGIIGKTIGLSRHSYTVIGVTPPEFRGTMAGLAFDMWVPLMMHEQLWPGSGPLQSRDKRWLHAMARLQAGVELKQAQTVAATVAGQLARTYPDSNKDVGIALLPLWDSPFGGQRVFGPVVALLMTVTIGVLLIVAANVANLLLARASVRQKEIAVRQAVGAGRWRLLRQLLTESLILSLLGAVGGVLFAAWAVGLFAALTPTTNLPIVTKLSMDRNTLLFSLLLASATGLIFGLAPSLYTMRVNLSETLKEGGRTSAPGSGKNRLRNLLVVSEIALAVLLLIGAGLCLRSLRSAHRIYPGFDSNNVLLTALNLSARGYSEQEGRDFFRRLSDRLAVLPGVQSAALAAWVPLGFVGSRYASFQIEGYVPGPKENMNSLCNIITPRYIEAMRIPLLKGRHFTDADDLRAEGVAIINEAMARRFWPGQDPVGRRMTVYDTRRVTVVGLVKDGKYLSLGEEPQPFIFLPFEQFYEANMTVHLRSSVDPTSLAPAVRREMQAIDAGVTPWSSESLATHLEAAFLTQRIAAVFLGILGLLALALASMGVYGVMAYSVSRRIHEIGVRMALGACAADVLGLLVRQGMRLAVAGVGLGLLAAFALSPAMSRLLYGVSVRDPLVFSCVPVLLIGVALLACYVPAQRASRVNPIEALRYE